MHECRSNQRSSESENATRTLAWTTVIGEMCTNVSECLWLHWGWVSRIIVKNRCWHHLQLIHHQAAAVLTYAALLLIVFAFTINVDLPFIMPKRLMLAEEKPTWSIILFTYPGSCSPSPTNRQIPTPETCSISRRYQIPDFETIGKYRESIF